MVLFALELAIDACVRILKVDSSAAIANSCAGLAEFAVSPERSKQWEKESVIGLAHYHLAMLDHTEAVFLFAQAEKLKENPEKLKENPEALKTIVAAARKKYDAAIDHFRKLPSEKPDDLSQVLLRPGQGRLPGGGGARQGSRGGREEVLRRRDPPIGCRPHRQASVRQGD